MNTTKDRKQKEEEEKFYIPMKSVSPSPLAFTSSTSINPTAIFSVSL